MEQNQDGRPNPGSPRRWPQVVLALLALAATVGLIVLGPAGWAGLVVVWAFLLLLRRR